MKTLFCILGRTASGKDSLSNEICKKYNLKKLISYTTRPPRNEFEDTHIFTNMDKFAEHYINSQVVAYTQIGDYIYWSTTEQLFSNDIYIIDYSGLKQLKQANISDLKIVTIYIKAPEEERHKRALIRSSDATAHWRRNDAEKEQFDEIEQKQDYDYCIYNSRFIDAQVLLEDIIKTERNI